MVLVILKRLHFSQGKKLDKIGSMSSTVLAKILSESKINCLQHYHTVKAKQFAYLDSICQLLHIPLSSYLYLIDQFFIVKELG